MTGFDRIRQKLILVKSKQQGYNVSRKSSFGNNAVLATRLEEEIEKYEKKKRGYG